MNQNNNLYNNSLFFNDTINSLLSNTDALELNYPQTTKVLMIYTGGTIGMKNSKQTGYTPVPGYLSKMISSMSKFNDPTGTAFINAETAQSILQIEPNTIHLPIKYANQVSESIIAINARKLPHSLILIDTTECIKTQLPVY